tara:strand:- start:22938 stop:23561 length:624 start_codon:yes stop_codon:yes gene_type:complete
MSLIRRWNAAVGTVADHLQVFTFLGLTFASVIGLVAWLLAAASGFLKPYAPISYFFASLIAFLLASAVFWLIASGIKKIAAASSSTGGNASDADKRSHSGPWAGVAKANLAVWRQIDPLTLEQAACLWAGVEPPPVPDKMLLGEAAARLVQLRQAAGSGQIGPVPVHWLNIKDPANPVQVPPNARVRRDHLKAYAQSIGERPGFLAD